MTEPLVVAFAPGVTPGKWERTWRERRMGILDLRPLPQADAIAALRAGTVHMAFLRDVEADDEWHAIPLYRERPVVVASRDSLLAALDSVRPADLAGESVLPVDLDGGDGGDAVELAAANAGVVVAPQSIARLHSRKDLVARPLEDAPDTGVSLVWPRNDEGAHGSVDAFIGIVRGRTPNSSR